MNGKIITISNQKGGVGKTTSTIEIAANLTRMGKKVLVVDFDPQGDTTRSVGGDADYKNIFDVLNVTEENFVPIKESIQKTDYFDLICSAKALTKIGATIMDARDDIYLLADVLDSVRDSYDYILIDNNPDASTLAYMSMVAADYVIIPATPDDNALEGVRETENTLKKLTSSRNQESHAQILGYILVRRVKSSIVHSINYEKLVEIADEKNTQLKPFVASISQTVKIDEAKLLRTPISTLSKSSTQAREYYEIAETIIERLEKEA